MLNSQCINYIGIYENYRPNAVRAIPIRRFDSVPGHQLFATLLRIVADGHVSSHLVDRTTVPRRRSQNQFPNVLGEDGLCSDHVGIPASRQKRCLEPE
jgi:hypothetical protein